MFLAPPLSPGSVCQVPQQKGNEKTRQSGVVPLVPFTTFAHGSVKITGLTCNELNWTGLLGGNMALQSNTLPKFGNTS